MQIVSIIVEDGIVGVGYCVGGVLLRWGNEGWGNEGWGIIGASFRWRCRQVHLDYLLMGDEQPGSHALGARIPLCMKGNLNIKHRLT